MTLFDYLYACSLWQWCGNLAAVGLIAWGVRHWSFLNINSGMNSGSIFTTEKGKP